MDTRSLISQVKDHYHGRYLKNRQLNKSHGSINKAQSDELEIEFCFHGKNLINYLLIIIN